MILYNQKRDLAMTEEEWVEAFAEGNFKDVDWHDLIEVEYNPMTGEWEEV